MTAPTPCSRHRRRVWMAACPDCTAWHLAVALARRDAVVSGTATALTADHATSPPAAANVPPAALRLVT
jgi:hypothetical protein